MPKGFLSFLVTDLSGKVIFLHENFEKNLPGLHHINLFDIFVTHLPTEQQGRYLDSIKYMQQHPHQPAPSLTFRLETSLSLFNIANPVILTLYPLHFEEKMCIIHIFEEVLTDIAPHKPLSFFPTSLALLEKEKQLLCTFCIHNFDRLELDFKFVHPSFESITGFPSHILCQPPKTWIGHIHPDDRKGLLNTLRSLSNLQGTKKDIFRMFHGQNKKPLWIELLWFPISDPEGKKFEVYGMMVDVTHVAEPEQFLELLYQAVEKTSDLVFMTDQEGHITFVNRAFEEVTGYTRDEVLGKTPRILKSGHHKREFYQCMWNKILQGEIFRGVFVNRKKDGSLFYEKKTIVPVQTRENKYVFISTGKDITHILKATKALEASEARFRALVENSPMGIAILEDDLSVEFFNPAMETITGLKLDFVRGSPFETLIYPEDKQIFFNLLSNIDQWHQPSNPSELRLKTVDDARWVLMVISRVMEMEPSKILVNAIDIHQLKEMEHRLFHAQKMEAIGRLAGGIAHDFNNLLTAILGNAQLLMMQLKPDEPGYQNIIQIMETAHRATQLIRQILDFSRPSFIQVTRIDINKMLIRMQTLIGSLIGENIRVEFHLADNLPQIKGETSLLEQVFMNLIVNARDAMPDGGTIRIETRLVQIQSPEFSPHYGLDPGHYIQISFSDTGTGIPSEAIDRIFEPYFTTKKDGSGLGLATAYSIVKRLNGHIFVYSEPDHGTTFHIYFPAIRESDSEQASTPAPHRPPRFQRGCETILVVEDESTIRDLLRQSLMRLGYSVETAGDIASAQAIWSAKKKNFHLVISDMILPDGNGLDFIQSIRQECPSLPVILTSGYTGEQAILLEKETSNLYFLKKPFTLDELSRLIRKVLQRPPSTE